MISEVELTGSVNSLMEEYRTAYRERYHTNPICQNIGIESTVLRDIIKLVGFPRAKLIVRGYLKQPGDKEWYIRKGHDLETLKNNLHAINAAVGGERFTTYNITLDSRCPRCEAYFKLTGPANDVCYNVYMVLCKTCENILAGAST